MNKLISFFKDFNKQLFALDPETKKISFLVFMTYFLVLFSYPLARSSVGAIFYEYYTSNDYSMATFIGVIALMSFIFINNKLQMILGVHKVYFLTGLLTVITLLGSYFLLKQGFRPMAYVMFAAKEAYIVLLVHTCLAFINSYYNLDMFKKLIGPIGAAGSMGGILGGQLTKYVANQPEYGTEAVFYLSLIFIFLTALTFYQTRSVKVRGLEPNKSITPLVAVRGVKKYVLLIASIVALSQFVIYVADLQFNLIFEKVVTEKNARTVYLGNFYTYINILSLFLQLVALPYLLVKIKLRSIFLFVPILYLLLVIGGLGLGASQLLVVALVFICMKGTDYSVFAVVKEVMYHPLLSLQKFGAKYITDMFVYRLSKALIAFVFAQFALKNMPHITMYLSWMQFGILSLWIFLIYKLFQEQNKLSH